jgi:mannosyl-3-phosphoglycerate phosphatase family protein
MTGGDRPVRVVFTDLDGTLLELERYDPEPAVPALHRLRRAGVPVVFCSSKTRAEQEELRERLGVSDPFIVENGSAVHLPGGGPGDGREDGPGDGGDSGEEAPQEDEACIRLGIPVAEIRAALAEEAGRQGIRCQGYADLSLEEVVEETGLDPEAARRAATREWSETILRSSVAPDDPRFRRMVTALGERGIRSSPGSRFHTLTGTGADKGAAVRRLMERYRDERGAVESIGIGDAANDVPMLAAVDRAYLVQRPDGSWAPVAVSGLHRLPAPGPEGWRLMVEREGLA